MTIFAQVVAGKIFDPQPNATEAEYRARNPVFNAAPVVVEVPDGTQQGATSDGQGGWINPPPKVPPPYVPKPITMTDKQFRKYAAQKLGSAAAVGLIYKAAAASADGDVQYAFMAWSKAQTFEKAEVEALTAVLVTAAIMTGAQRDKLIGANWPEA